MAFPNPGRRCALLCTALISIGASTAISRRAVADEAAPATCLLRAVHATPGTQGKEEVDPQITRLRARLQKPPFTAWHKFQLLSSKEEAIAPGGSAAFALPNGKSATVAYTSHDLGEGGKHVVRGELRLESARSNAKIRFALDEGGVFTVAGEKFQGGILIYALSCKTAE